MYTGKMCGVGEVFWGGGLGAEVAGLKVGVGKEFALCCDILGAGLL